MHYELAVLPGDGVGPEVVSEGVKVLQTVGDYFRSDAVTGQYS